MRTPFRFAAALGLAGAVLAACSGGATPTPAPTATPTAAPSAAPTEAPTATPNACAPENLKTLTAGTLTIGTDNPAYPPYLLPRRRRRTRRRGTPSSRATRRPATGFESAVAYAVAEQLGFAKDKVAWVASRSTTRTRPGRRPSTST